MTARITIFRTGNIPDWPKCYRIGEASPRAGLGGSSGSGFRVQTEDELEKAVSAALAAKDKCALIEVILGPTDCSDILTELGRKVRGMSK